MVIVIQAHRSANILYMVSERKHHSWYDWMLAEIKKYMGYKQCKQLTMIFSHIQRSVSHTTACSCDKNLLQTNITYTTPLMNMKIRFVVRSWNIGMCCMSFYVVIRLLTSEWILWCQKLYWKKNGLIYLNCHSKTPKSDINTLCTCRHV